NGAAYKDNLTADGKVHDQERLNYVRDHLLEAHEAIRAGVNLKGYFLWSLMDNFEWAFGKSKRFGIVYTDYETQARYLKDSALWYSNVIKRNGL
ncbi:MAG: family 1 glycosylhydrolase, partial [Candidatus Obscuribacterales bacterium]|nr:family 1 glycosylhydrolase [Candidatus Obscuribacterales bacterium]